MDNRLQNLRVEMKKQNLDAVFISNVPNITYLTNFSGFFIEDRDAFLFITKNSQYIFTHGIYKEAAQKFIKNFTLIEMKRENPVSKSIKTLIEKNKIKTLGFEDFDLRVVEYKNLLKFVNKRGIKPTRIVNKLREIKSDSEILNIKKACNIGDEVYSQVLKNIRINITEKELALEIEFRIRKLGAAPSFPTIVAFGANSSHPHHVPTDKKLTQNNFVLMDFGVKFNNYCSDMSRTVFFGKANPEQKKVYQTVLESQQKAIEFVKENCHAELVSASSPTTKKILKRVQDDKLIAGKVDKIARIYITRNGFPTIPHSLGHGIGLEVHEDPKLHPTSNDVLKNGMAFSIEPGIYLPDKFGIRIEDLFAIENNKLTPLTHSPRELIEI